MSDSGRAARRSSPASNANGTDSFTFKANDGTVDSNVATVTVTITAMNDAPVASNGTLTTNEDTAASGTLTAGDVDGNPLTYSIVANGAKGTVTVTNASTGAYTYTANAGASGSDTFTFKANDGSLDSNVATITVTIATNRPPVATNGSLPTQEDRSASGTFAGSDPDGNRLTFSIVSNGSKGIATIANATMGRFTYVPTANANGTDAFTFKANDGLLDSNTATVTVTITPVNDAPAAADGTLTTRRNTSATGALQAVDVDGDVLTFSITKAPRRGTVVLTNPATGAFTFTPNANFTGNDSFTFRVTDGAATASGTISVTVTP